MKKTLTFIMLLGIMITLMIPKITTKADNLYGYGFTSIPFELSIEIDGRVLTLDMITHESEPQDEFASTLLRINNGETAISWNYTTDDDDCYYWFDEEFGYYGDDGVFIISNIDSIVLTFTDLCITRSELLQYTPWLDNMPSYVNYDASLIYLDENGELKSTYLTGRTQTPLNALMTSEIVTRLDTFATNGQILIEQMALEIVPSNGWTNQENFHLYVPIYDVLDPSAGNVYYRPFSMRDFFYDYEFNMPSFDGGSWLATAVGGFLDTPIFGFISIGSLLLVVVAIPLVIALLKFFAGG